MPQINFGYEYDKLKEYRVIDTETGDMDLFIAQDAYLIGVFPVKLEKLHKSFIAYDTDYGIYKLPKKGKALMLLFQKNDYDCFTTLRRETPQKLKYYKSLTGQKFDIIITKDTERN